MIKENRCDDVDRFARYSGQFKILYSNMKLRKIFSFSSITLLLATISIGQTIKSTPINIEDSVQLKKGSVENSRIRRAATARQDRLWDDAVIPYEIDSVFSDDRATLFRNAMRHWENYTCIKFVERQPEEHRNYIVFTERSCGCCSFVGKRGNGAQAISIGKHCDKFGIVVHELGHVVGFWHEHTRPDRDQHVQIISKNIMSGQEYNFNKLTKDEVNSLGLAYDYDSILHYATNTFAKDTYLDTILPLHGHLNTEETVAAAAAASAPLVTKDTSIPQVGNNNVASNFSTSVTQESSTSVPFSSVTQASKSTNKPAMSFNSSGGPPHMINDLSLIQSQLMSNFQSMLEFDGSGRRQAIKHQKRSPLNHKEEAQRQQKQHQRQHQQRKEQIEFLEPKMLLLDGSIVVSAKLTPSDRESNLPSRRKRAPIDVDDGLHMLAMDNLLAKSRPEIGQRIRLSVGDIAQTNLLYKCPKCGRTIQQTSGIIHSPNYFSNHGSDTRADKKLQSNEIKDNNCEWRLSVGQGERIMINLTDLDIAPPTTASIHHNLPPSRFGMPKVALSDYELYASQQQYHTPSGYTAAAASSNSKDQANAMIMTNCVSDYIEIRDGYTYRAPLIARLCGHLASVRDFLRPIVSTGNRLLINYKTTPSSVDRRGFLAQHEALCGGIIILGNSLSAENLYSSSTPLTTTTTSSSTTPASTTTSSSITGSSGIGASLSAISVSSPISATVPTATTQSSFPLPNSVQKSQLSGALTNVNHNLSSENLSSNKIVINGSSSSPSSSPLPSFPSENEVLLSSQTNLRYHALQSQQQQQQSNLNERSMDSSLGDINATTAPTSTTSSSAPAAFSPSSLPGFNAASTTDAPSSIVTSASQRRHQQISNMASVQDSKNFPWNQWPVINASIIQSPNWPDSYRPSKECHWNIRAEENHQISLKFESFDLESHDSCAYDYVEIRDGDNMNSDLIGRFCGNRIPEQILSSSPSLFVKFVSDSDINRGGFLASLQLELDECKLGLHGCSYKCSNAAIPYRCECPNGLELAADGKNCVPTCGGVKNETSGQIISPSFPDSYPVSTKCVWEIQAPAQHKITLNFTHFDLEGIKAQECDYDFVVIRSKLEDGKYVKNGIYCGPNQALVVTSVANVMRIEFNSDNSIQRSGFMANYFIDRDECATNNGGCQHVCTNTIGSYECSCNNGFILHENKHSCVEGHCTHSVSNPEGTFSSPNFPNTYQPNKECAWVFSTAPGHRIKLVFDQFELESHQECAYDQVVVFDGEGTDDPVLGRFCGSRRPLSLISSFNMLYLLFRSDATNEKRGFNATHSTVCGGRVQAYLNQTDYIYSHPQFDGTTHYNRNEDCEWLIEANYNQRVRIEFTFFALESDNNCNYDHTIVYDGADDTATQLARLCGSDILKDQSRITSSSESLLIVFRSDDSINNRGFSLTYTAIEISEDESAGITYPMSPKHSQLP